MGGWMWGRAGGARSAGAGREPRPRQPHAHAGRLATANSPPAHSRSQPSPLCCTTAAASATAAAPPPHLLVVLAAAAGIKLRPPGRLPQLLRGRRVAVQAQRGQRAAAGEELGGHAAQAAGQQRVACLGRPAAVGLPLLVTLGQHERQHSSTGCSHQQRAASCSHRLSPARAHRSSRMLAAGRGGVGLGRRSSGARAPSWH